MTRWNFVNEFFLEPNLLVYNVWDLQWEGANLLTIILYWVSTKMTGHPLHCLSDTRVLHEVILCGIAIERTLLSFFCCHFNKIRIIWVAILTLSSCIDITHKIGYYLVSMPQTKHLWLRLHRLMCIWVRARSKTPWFGVFGAWWSVMLCLGLRHW